MTNIRAHRYKDKETYFSKLRQTTKKEPRKETEKKKRQSPPILPIAETNQHPKV